MAADDGQKRCSQPSSPPRSLAVWRRAQGSALAGAGAREQGGSRGDRGWHAEPCHARAARANSSIRLDSGFRFARRAAQQHQQRCCGTCFLPAHRGTEAHAWISAHHHSVSAPSQAVPHPPLHHTTTHDGRWPLATAGPVMGDRYGFSWRQRLEATSSALCRSTPTLLTFGQRPRPRH